MSGWIFGDEKSTLWTQTHRRRKTRIRNPIHQNFGHIKAVQELLTVKEHSIHGIVAFVGDAVPKTPMPNTVVWNIPSLVRKIKAYRVPVFTQSLLDQMRRTLSSPTIVTDRETRKEHITNAQRIAEGLEKPSVPICSRCGSEMVLRTNKKTGDGFYGCSNFPKCRRTKKISQPQFSFASFPHFTTSIPLVTHPHSPYTPPVRGRNRFADPFCFAHPVFFNADSQLKRSKATTT